MNMGSERLDMRQKSFEAVVNLHRRVFCFILEEDDGEMWDFWGIWGRI